MIDLHSHILPNLDDGSQSINDSLSMAKTAYQNGTMILTATPHANLPNIERFDEAERAKYAFMKFKEELKNSDTPLKLALGMEIFYTQETVSRLKSGELITLNGTRYPLVEFDFSVDSEIIVAAMKKLINAGYTPVLAHPERYRCFSKDITVLYDLYEMGVILQINKGSVFGYFGERVYDVVDAILRHRLACVAASDAHNTYSRTTDMAKFSDYLDINYGEGCSPLLLHENPLRILRDEEIYWDSPIPF